MSINIPSTAPNEKFSDEENDMLRGLRPNKNGLWVFWRWECNECGLVGLTEKYDPACQNGIKHNEETGHRNIGMRMGIFHKDGSP